MKITITGASGFVGKNLSSYLEKKGMTVERLSLRDSWKFPDNGDVIIHLAGKAHDTSNTAEEAEYLSVNRDLTIALFNEFLKSDFRDFFFFSSVKAVADEVEEVLTEEVIPMPKTLYGKSKLEAETYLLNQYLPANKRLFIIRPCMIHGPGNKGNLNLLYQLVQKGIPWPLAVYENQRSFLSIDNLNFLVEKMLASDVPSGVYNMADDESVSTICLIKLIGKTTKRKIKLWKIPRKLISFAAKTGDVVGLPLNSERLKKLTENYIVSNQKLKNALNIQKLPVSAEEGLEKTIKCFKN